MANNLSPHDMQMLAVYQNINQNNIQSEIHPDIQNDPIHGAYIGGNSRTSPQVPHQAHKANSHNPNQPIQHHMGGRDNFNNRKQENQQSFPTFTVDLSSPEKMNQFFHERLNTVVKRISPYLNGERQKEDLKWSVSELNNFYENKIDELEQEKEEGCESYFKKNHYISVSQSTEMFKYAQNVLKMSKEADIDTDQELQHTVSGVFNDILHNSYNQNTTEYFHESSKTVDPDTRLGEGYNTHHQTPGYDANYYQEEG